MIRRMKIKTHERGLLFREGELVSVLEPGVHWYLDPLLRLRLQLESPRGPWLVHPEHDLIVKSGKLGDEAIRVVDSFGLEAIKTQDVAGVLTALNATGRVLVVAPAGDEKLRLSARNLPTVEVILADSLNVVDILNADTVVIEQPALARMEEVYL